MSFTPRDPDANRTRNALVCLLIGIVLLLTAWAMWLRESRLAMERLKHKLPIAGQPERLQEEERALDEEAAPQPAGTPDARVPAASPKPELADKQKARIATYLLLAGGVTILAVFTLLYAVLRAGRGARRLLTRKPLPRTEVIDAWAMHRMSDEEVEARMPVDDEGV